MQPTLTGQFAAVSGGKGRPSTEGATAYRSGRSGGAAPGRPPPASSR